MALAKFVRKIRGVKRFYRFYLKTKYDLLQKPGLKRVVLEHVCGKPFIILPNVMNPKIFRTGAFFARSLNADLIGPSAHVLDMGTGCGVAAIVAAQFAASVVAVDINVEAVRCARINALMNQTEEKINILQSDLFEHVQGERFDVILFNPPFFAGSTENDFQKAFFGLETIERFARQVTDHLNPGGILLLMLSSLADLSEICKQFHQVNLPLELVRERHYINETLLLLRATYQSEDWEG